MAPKIFLTGVTGYIAGDALFALQKAHPNYEYSALVRTKEKGDIVQTSYPNVRIVIGGLDDDEILKTEAAKADIILHAADASDHEGAARAIAAGIAEGHSKERPGYWLHTGGTGILTFTDAKSGKLGNWTDKQYNDWNGVDEVVNLPDDAFHRNVDKIVLEAGQEDADVVRTAIVCPPTIYGEGRGPVSGRGRQTYELAKLVLNGQYIPIIGAGKARWNNVHIEDLSDVYVLLLEAAVAGKADGLWGAKGYYFTENGEHVWGDLARHTGKEAEKLGLAKSLQEKSLEREAALEQAGFEAESWGLNSRAKAERAKHLLGWKPSRQSIEDEIPTILKSEHELLSKNK